VKKITLSANTLAQYGHFVSGLAAVFAAKIFFHAPNLGGIVWLALMGIKEAFVDPAIEEAVTAGSGLEDWAWHATGVSVAILLVLAFTR